MNMTVLTDKEITESVFSRMYDLENRIWPEGHFAHLSREYLNGLFSLSREGVFAAWDKDRDTLAGHFYVIVTDEENIRKYLATEDFTVLKNKGFQPGSNIMYLYTAILKEEYRGSGCMKQLGIAFCRWLDAKEAQGYRIGRVYAEAVSEDGARVCSRGFLMTPMEDVDEKGVGHYVSHDGLKSYREKMRKRYAVR